MNDTNVWYLAGPMTGYPKDNLPAFIDAASALRTKGFSIVTPVELDGEEAIKAVLCGDVETFNDAAGTTWGSALARDVEIIADDIGGIIFLDGWEKSRGARLEAFVGLLCGHDFARYVPGGNIERMHPHGVLTDLARQTHTEIRNARQ